MTQEQIESIDYTQPPSIAKPLIYLYHFTKRFGRRANYDNKIMGFKVSHWCAKILSGLNC